MCLFLLVLVGVCVGGSWVCLCACAGCVFARGRALLFVCCLVCVCVFVCVLVVLGFVFRLVVFVCFVCLFCFVLLSLSFLVLFCLVFFLLNEFQCNECILVYI